MPTPSRTAIGVVLSLASSLSFALNLTTARLAYEAGADSFTVSLTRTTFLAVVLFLVLKLAGRPVAFPPRQGLARATLGTLMAVQILTLLAAIQLMPIGLTVLIYYTSPIAVAGIVAALDRQRPPPRRLAAMAAAFAGLAIALAVDPEALSWRGIACALVSALGFAVTLVWAGRGMAGQDSHVLSFHIMGVAAVIFIVIAAAGETLVWPANAGGWAALGASSILFTSATLCLFAAIARIGAVRASLIDYASPILAIVMGILFLGEHMTAIQWGGAALVVGAILLDQLADMRARRAESKA